MKFILSLILIYSSVLYAGDQPGEIYKTEKAITIDGKLDEPAWKNAVKIPTKYFDKQGGGGVNEKVLAYTQFCWDKDYLYIAYETFDSDLNAFSKDEAMGPAGNKRTPAKINPAEHPKIDVVEFFVTWGSPNFFWELHHNAKNDFSDVWCVTAEKNWEINKTKAFQYGIHFGDKLWIDDYNDGKVTLKKAVTLKPKADGKPSTVNDSSDKDTGYISEIRLPIGSIAVPNKAEVFVKKKDEKGNERRVSDGFNLENLPIKILTVVQDMTSERRYHHSSPTRTGGWFHHDAANWNQFIFKSKTAP